MAYIAAMTREFPVRPSVLLAVRTKASLLDHVQKIGPLGGLWIPGYLHRKVGERVDLEIAFSDDKMLFHSRGVVRWKRLTSHRRLPAGIGVEFLRSEERTRDLLLQFASGEEVGLTQRKTRRFPVKLDVECGPERPGVTEDLSRLGACILADHPVDVGSVIKLRLKPPGDGDAIDVKAEVVWRRDELAHGVQFCFDSEEAREALRELIATLKVRQEGTGG